MSYQPQTSTLQMIVRGSGYQFSPQAFTAGTINVGTVNATKLNGTVNAAQMPLFGISGSGHSPGAVPDPGATAGSTRFLREDGIWAAPGGGTSNGTAGGDLSGSFPNPTVSAVHASSGTLNGVVIGAAAPSSGSFTSVIAGANHGIQFAASASGGGYNNFTLNGNNGDDFRLGFVGGGGGDNNLYLDVPAGGSFLFRAGATSTFIGGLSASGYSGPGLNIGSGNFTVDGSGNVKAGTYHETLTTPASSSSACNPGDFTDDANFHYVCTAPNTWKRAALTSF